MDLIVGDDGRARPSWAVSRPMYLEYYDTEWGVPVRDERGLFERLSLEVFQCGLSWSTILNKRERFREVFHDFVPDTVAAFSEADVERLMGDAGIVRNRRKIEATISNAQATIALRDDGGLPLLIWSHLPEVTPAPATMADIRAVSAESVALSKALKKRGFRFVGPTTMYALTQAIGMEDDHPVGSWRRGSSGVFGPDGRALPQDQSAD
ncbi:MAG: DNA-3-methyladenine glycosylase I [Propionibacterium sp.]|nr:DNA-3-methyladenine glycosylase I [Propionibacterium sp.]